MKAFLAGRRIVMGAAFLAGLALWAFSAADNALNYTEVVSAVERLEEVCWLVGEPFETATGARCAEAQASPPGKWRRHRVVHVRYQSPADGQKHTGVVIPIGGQAAVDASRLSVGDR